MAWARLLRNSTHTVPQFNFTSQEFSLKETRHRLPSIIVSFPTFPSRHSAAKSSSAKVRENEPKRFAPLETEDVGRFLGIFLLGDVVYTEIHGHMDKWANDAYM